MTQKKVAVILSGCGVYDGAEIHESVITLLRLDQRGAKVQCFAPNIAQLHVINHLTGDEMPESRNVLVESARIARGNIKDIREAKVDDFDALIVPGRFGAAKNLSSFATEGDKCTVQTDVLALAGNLCRSGQAGGPDVHLTCHRRQNLRPWRDLHHWQRCRHRQHGDQNGRHSPRVRGVGDCRRQSPQAGQHACLYVGALHQRSGVGDQQDGRPRA